MRQRPATVGPANPPGGIHGGEDRSQVRGKDHDRGEDHDIAEPDDRRGAGRRRTRRGTEDHGGSQGPPLRPEGEAGRAAGRPGEVGFTQRATKARGS